MEQKSNHFDVIVVGGGASGMMTAGIAGERNLRVLLLEKNKTLGEKLKITGGGRCNITNNEDDLRKFLAVYRDAEKFLYSAFSQFDKNSTKEFFAGLGLPVVVQERNRCFPKTEKALDVFKTLEAFIKKGGVTVRTNSPVTKIEKKGSEISGVFVGDVKYTANSYVIATGGVSHPETGSTGDGFIWLQNLGHTVSAPNPNIVPLKVKEKWVKKIPGTLFSDCKIYFYLDGKRMFDRRGNILCTHFGISGPLVLNSAYEVLALLEKGSVTCSVDMFPDKNLGELEQYLLQIFEGNKNKALKNVLKEITVGGIVNTVIESLGFVGDQKVHSVTRDERKKIVQLLKAMKFTIAGSLGYDKAVVSDGGVVLTEVDTKDFRSKTFHNLFFTGDMLHINRPSGGYSLQLCWTSGYVVGKNV
jgi:predicted Rossmann fold flavoprotein